MKPQPSPTRVRKILLSWFAQHRRDLPWRATHDPYLIAVSEVMLQQTQVDRVVPKFLAWRWAWPNTRSLANAPLHDVLKLWSGLGYNARALRLREAAREVMKKHQGSWPRTIEELESLPGFGPYTARAVASFSYNANVFTIDTNIRRILSRVFFGAGEISTKKVEKISNDILPIGKSAAWHAALMDFGSAVCTSRPKCTICPLQTMCRAYPAILTHTRSKNKVMVQFKTSDRFWRGAIMRQLLKVSPLTQSQITQALKKDGNVDNKRVARLLRALVTAGLIEQHRQTFRISD